MCSDVLDAKLNKALQRKRGENLYRTRLARTNSQDAFLQIGDQQYLNFCSNDYLGLANHPDLISCAKKALDKYGVGSGGSALVTGYTEIHQRLEDSLAEFTNRSRVLLFSSGFAANTSILAALSNKEDLLLMDKLCHASLIDGARLSRAKLQRYPHLDMASLDKRAVLAKAEKKQAWLISESLFSMDGDTADLKMIAEISQKNSASVYIDDAHGFGIYGENGAGSISAAKLTEKQVPVMVATFGKAFGVSGAFVAGSVDLVETLIQDARSSVYSTAVPPMIAAAVLKSLDLVENETWRREKLFESIDYFRSKAVAKGIKITENAKGPIQPIIIGESEKAMQISETLFEKGIKISAIRPPTVPLGSARLRITFSAFHKKAHIDSLIEALAEVL